MKGPSIVIIAVAITLAACTAPQRYAAGRQMQRDQCLKQPDATLRERCLRDADTSFDDYQRGSRRE